MGVPNRGFGPSRARACVYRYLYLLIMGVPKPQIGGFQIAMILMGSLKWPLLGPKYGPFGPLLGPSHPLLVPFGTPSGTPYPLSHRGRVPRGVLIPMCHVTKCSSDPFILTPTR